MAETILHDAIILGGGPAGLAAGVYLGRYLRPTLILDHKKPQTRWHRPIAHNVLGFPAGIHRNQLLDWGRAHIAKYDSVQLLRTTIASIAQQDSTFVLASTDGQTFAAKGLILAPGIEYLLPDIPDIFDYAGHSIWHCPECDGYKCQGQKIVVISGPGTGRGSAEMALGLAIWTDDITLCTNGTDAELDPEAATKLAAAGIPVVNEKITRILGNPDDGQIEAFVLANGRQLPAAGAFANQGSDSPEELLKQLPLDMYQGRWVNVDYRMRTNIARCYAAGDIVAHAQTQLSVAMGTGATAAIWLHKELLPQNLCLSGRDW